jgi:WD40 repeat protein
MANGIVSGGADKTVKVWDTATGQEALTLKGHTAMVRSVALSADGKLTLPRVGGVQVKGVDFERGG